MDVGTDILDPCFVSGSYVDVNVQYPTVLLSQGLLGFGLYELYRALKDCLEQLLAGQEFVAGRVIFLHDAEQAAVFDIAPELHPFVVIIVPLPQHHGPLELFVCLQHSLLSFI